MFWNDDIAGSLGTAEGWRRRMCFALVARPSRVTGGGILSGPGQIAPVPVQELTATVLRQQDKGASQKRQGEVESLWRRAEKWTKAFFRSRIVKARCQREAVAERDPRDGFPAAS